MHQFKEIRIENTNRCGYKCLMCPREKHDRTQGMMSVEDFQIVLERVGLFEGEMHLHGFGEPLLDRHLPDKVRLVKERMPKAKTVVFSTLGVPFKEPYFSSLAEAGLTAIFVSCYGYNPDTYKKVHGVDQFHRLKENLRILSEVRKKNNNCPHVLVMPSSDEMLYTLSSQKDDRKAFQEWVESLGIPFTFERQLHNYGDGREYNIPKEERLCPVIRDRRRSILQVTWDLNVIPCCYDFNATIRFGNLRESSLEEIFSSKAFFQFSLAHLTQNLRDYKVCQNCEKDQY